MINEGFMHLFILFLIVLAQASILHARPGPPENDKERPSHHHQELEGVSQIDLFAAERQRDSDNDALICQD